VRRADNDAPGGAGPDYAVHVRMRNKRGFEMVERKMVDIQRLEIEECPENLEGSAQARKIGVFIKNDLVDPKFQKRVVPGSKVVVTGILEDIPIKADKTGKESKRRDIYIDGNYIEPIEFEFAEIELSPDDIKRIKEFAENPKIYEMLIESIARHLWIQRHQRGNLHAAVRRREKGEA